MLEKAAGPASGRPQPGDLSGHDVGDAFANHKPAGGAALIQKPDRPTTISLDLCRKGGKEEPTIVDHKPEEILDAKSARLAQQNIRPPDLPPPQAALEPPLASIPKTSASPVNEAAVKVKIRTGDESGDDGSPTRGLAPFNTRAAAMVIDLVVAIGVIIGLNLILPGFAHKLSWLIGAVYVVTRDSLPFLGGQSVGKKAMNLRAVTLDGKPLTGNWEPSLIRGGVLIIPFFQLLELWILLTREETAARGRRLGDEWAKTKVIIEEKPLAADVAD